MKAIITPEKATELLAANTCNRSISKDRLARYAGAMSRGEWVWNGDTIKVAHDGTLLDGQHRLLAVVKSGVTIETEMVVDLPRTVFDTIDQGQPRTYGQILAMLGVGKAKDVASIARCIYIYEKHGDPFYPTAQGPSAKQIENLVIEDGEIEYCAKSVGGGGGWVPSNMSASVGGFCLWAFRRHDKENADRFFDLLRTGVGLSQESPVYHLREQLMANKASKRKMNQRYKAALTFKAFRKFLSGEKVKRLRVRMEGDAAELDIFSI